MLIQNIKEKIINKYVIESKYLYNFFIYWKEEFLLKNISSDKIIKEIIKKIKENEKYDVMPHFIIQFFEKIGILLSLKIYTLNSFEDRETFKKVLKEIIIESVQDYLGIETTNAN
jgi:hypothetical protein